MKRTYESGATKRKKRKESEENLLKQKDSMLKFFKKADISDIKSVDENAEGMSISNSNTSTSVDECIINKRDVKSEELDKVEQLPSSCLCTSDTSLNQDETRLNLISSCMPESELSLSNIELEASVSLTNVEPELIPRPRPTTETEFSLDIALWPPNPTNEMIDFFTKNVPKNVGKIENLKKQFTQGNKTFFRRLHQKHFFRIKTNGEKEKRNWLIFSETTKSVYCYVCKLFPNPKETQHILIEGLSDWSRISKVLDIHETSKAHLTAMTSFFARSHLKSRVDYELMSQIEKEHGYWRKVLHRVVATVKLLAKLGLPFRGHREHESSQISGTNKNKGNFLSCLEYLSEFDEFLKEHLLKYEACGSGKTNYLSHQIYDEILTLMAKDLKQTLSDEAKEARYFAITVDSTPDLSHVDQLTFVIRYVTPDGQPVERFFGFIPIKSHKAEYLKETVLKVLNDLGLDIALCRGQCYDNASNMSGVYAGLQAKILEMSPKAFYVPCTSHTLNLVGNNAAESCSGSLFFFDLVQHVYTFFSASTYRWDTLISHLKPKQVVVKRLSDTRWSARADAVLALKKGYAEIQNALLEIHASEHENPTVKAEALGLAKKLASYETAVVTILWNRLLERLNKTSKCLQKEDGNMKMAVQLLESLKNYVLDVREDFSAMESEAQSLLTLLTEKFQCKEDEIKRLKRRKKFDDETPSSTDNEVILQGRDKVRVEIFNEVCDRIVSELKNRQGKLQHIFNIFQNLFCVQDDQLSRSHLKNLSEVYSNDIDGSLLLDELKHFREFLNILEETNTKSRPTVGEGTDVNVSKNCPGKWYKLIVTNDGLKETFPNLETILKIFLTIPISNASGERSFSALKRIKNYLRTTLSEDHLNDLAILYIESDSLKNISYDKLIDTFAAQKARKKCI